MTYLNNTLKIILLFLVSGLLMPAGAQAQSIIRDTEIEAYFKGWYAPLLKAGGLSENSVNVVIVQSDAINAFVAGGANIFLYTGLLKATEGPGEVIGVFAHELGHVAGGHLIGQRGALERASYESILGMVLGMGAAIATGNAGVANAIIHGSQNVAMRRYLVHSRVHENSADQAALRYLNDAQLNPTGLLTFMEKLAGEELLPPSQQSEYMRTHPLTRDRVETLAVAVAKSPYKETPLPAAWTEQHARMKAKLIGFLTPEHVPWRYDDRDQSIAARYARTISYYRQNAIDQALAGIDALITEEPDNPYFHELKGQMLVDFGRVEQAIAPYQKAISLAPEAGLIRLALGHALLETASGEAGTRKAIEHINRALRTEPRSARAHRLLATAHGRLGEDALAKLHLAEEAFLQRRLSVAKDLARRAKDALPENSRDWIKAADILNQVENMSDDDN